VNNFHPKIFYAKRLHEYFITTLPISQSHATIFLTSSILHPIQGFHVTDFPLWKLGCLLDENWVDEDVLNGMAELLYFQLAAALPDMAPGFLFLPTSFFNDAKHLYHAQTPQVFSENFVALRDRLCNSDVQSMGFIVWHNNHYAAYFYKRSESTCLLHNDSKGLKPAPDVLEIFSWLLSASGKSEKFLAPLNMI